MFESLSGKFEGVLSRLRGRGRIRERDIEDAVEQVRMSLLEADVHYRVVEEFVESVRRRALGREVLESLTADQQFVGIVRDELQEILGGERAELELSGKPAVIMLVGLQGSGKTTTAGKLARYLREERGRLPYLVPADVRRPAAIEQLEKVGAEISVQVHPTKPSDNPVKLCKKACKEADKRGFDTVIIDTAGRLAIDKPLMKELSSIKNKVEPCEILLVADAMTGSDAVEVSRRFNDEIGISGVVLTKLDGDARGGAALSIRKSVGCPIKFAGVGEKFDALEPFHPDRMASRILGMGDVLTLVEKAEKAFEEKQAEELQEKFIKNTFTIEDFLGQLRQIRKLGSVAGILEMLPGMGKMKKMLKGVDPEENIKRVEAIICSMTLEERRNHRIINGSRRKRIAFGSGTSVTEVNRFLKQFMQMKQMMRKVGRMSKRGMPPFLTGSF